MSCINVYLAYDASGIRTRKQAGTSVTDYVLSGDTVVAIRYGTKQYSWSNEVNYTGYLYFMRDENGVPYGFNYNGTEYYYRYNLQGDVTALFNASGTTVARYQYDPWGYTYAYDGNWGSPSSSHIANINPLRYRGYMYDAETGLYYLQSRYYDPATCRFLSPDSQLNDGSHVLGANLYAYCYSMHTAITARSCMRIMMGGCRIG